MAAAADLDEIEEVNANCILMANLQQASTSGTQTDKALVYDSKGSAEHDPPVVYDSEETPQLAQESRLKMKQLNKEIKPTNYTKINHLSGVFVSQTTMSREELYLSNTFNMANVSKSISIPNEEFSDGTTPSVALKFLNEVKSTIVTLQRVVKQKMTLDIHNWSSSAHQEIHKIVKDEIFPIVNQVDARVQNFEIQFLQEAAKFVRDFQSLANEADESLAMNKALELEIERLLRVVNKLHDTIYENAKLRAQLFDKVSDQKDTTKGTSTNTKFANQSTERKPFLQSLRNQFVIRQPNAFKSERQNASKTQIPQKVDKTHDLSNSVTSNSVPTTEESKVVDNDKVIALGMFRIIPFKNPRVEKFVPNKPSKASVRINSITASQPHVIVKKVVNSNSNGFLLQK
ncbi:hypothetical protein Tco_1523714 [Tanacetum coccineum]